MLGTTLFVPVLAAVLAASPPATLEKPSNRTLFERTARGAVHIATVSDGKAHPRGTGWVIDAKRRWVVTNFHVLPTGGDCLATFARFKDGRIVSDPKAYDLGKGIPGKVIESDPRCDLVLVQLDSLPEGARQLDLAAENPQPGDLLHLVGNPSASSGWWIYTIGRTRGLVRKVSYYGPKQTIECRVIEAQMDCNPGDSGSPVVNDSGAVVGVHSGSEKAAHIRGFAWHIDLDELKTFYHDVIALSDGTKVADAAVYARRGDRHRRKGNNDLAIADFSRALQLDPKRGDAYRHRSRLNFLRRRYDAALMDAYRAIELLPNDGQAYNERANAFYVRQDYKRAIADYSEAIRLLPDDAVVLVNRGATSALLKQDEAALKDFNAALKISPSFLRALEERGDLHRRRKNYAAAIADYQAGLRIAPNDAGLQARLGHAFHDNRQSTHAADAYVKALSLKVGQPAPVWRGLGRARYELKQWDSAIDALTNAIKSDATDGSAWFYRGAAREEKGEVDLAQADYQKAAELGVAEAKSLKIFTSRQVRVQNNTQEPLRVFLVFESPTPDGNWVRIPTAGAAAVEWTISPGGPTTLLYNKEAVQARAIRIRAVGAKTGKTWENAKKRTMLLVEAPYRALKQDVHVHTFGE